MTTNTIDKMKSLSGMEKFVVTAFEHNANDHKKGRELWMVLPPEWKGGVAASVAWANSFIEKNESIEKIDHSYYINKVKKDVKCWSALPRRIKTDFSFFKQIVHVLNVTGQEFWEVLYELPEHQRFDRDFWMILTSLKGNGVFFYYLRSHHPEQQHLLFDREIIWNGIKHNNRFAAQVVGPLLQDRSFWEQVLEKYPGALLSIPTETISQFPDLVHTALKEPSFASLFAEEYDISSFVLKLTDLDEFKSPSFLTKWLEKGMPLLNNSHNLRQFELFQRKNRTPDIYMLVAEHCENVEWKKDSFQELPEDLKTDKCFFMRAVTFSPDLLHAASEELQHDIDLAVLACSKSATALDHNPDLKKEMIQKIKQQWMEYEPYRIFQTSIKNQSQENIKCCPLATLPNEDSFIQILDEKVASFLGVPNLIEIHSAIQNLGG